MFQLWGMPCAGWYRVKGLMGAASSRGRYPGAQLRCTWTRVAPGLQVRCNRLGATRAHKAKGPKQPADCFGPSLNTTRKAGTCSKSTPN
jgi:hypothetical protein